MKLKEFKEMLNTYHDDLEVGILDGGDSVHLFEKKHISVTNTDIGPTMIIVSECDASDKYVNIN